MIKPFLFTVENIADKPDSTGFVAIRNIIAPITMQAGYPMMLSGTVQPPNATNQTITWSMVQYGSALLGQDGKTLSFNSPGTCTIRATVINGLSNTGNNRNYTQDFVVTATNTSGPAQYSPSITVLTGTKITLSLEKGDGGVSCLRDVIIPHTLLPAPGNAPVMDNAVMMKQIAIQQEWDGMMDREVLGILFTVLCGLGYMGIVPHEDIAVMQEARDAFFAEQLAGITETNVCDTSAYSTRCINS